MPKRKREDDYDYISRKIKKLKRKLRRKRRRIATSESSISDSSPQLTIPEDSEPIEHSVSTEEVNLDNLIGSTPDPSLIRPNLSNLDLCTETRPSILDEISADAPPADDGTRTSELDAELLEILGDDPTSTKKYGNDVQKDLAVRFEHSATMGLSKETKKELTEKYLIPENCKLIDAPTLNTEIKAALSDIVTKRDKAIAQKQKQMALAISGLSEAISLLIKSKDKNPTVLKLLMDTGRILCDCQYSDSLTRRNYILSAIKKDLKEQLRTTKIDDYLFGQNLSETLKAAKAINRSGAELKSASTQKLSSKKTLPSTSKSLNWKGPPVRRQPALQRTTEPAPPLREPAHPPRQRSQNNSKRSYIQQNSNRNRR